MRSKTIRAVARTAEQLQRLEKKLLAAHAHNLNTASTLSSSKVRWTPGAWRCPRLMLEGARVCGQAKIKHQAAVVTSLQARVQALELANERLTQENTELHKRHRDMASQRA